MLLGTTVTPLPNGISFEILRKSHRIVLQAADANESSLWLKQIEKGQTKVFIVLSNFLLQLCILTNCGGNNQPDVLRTGVIFMQMTKETLEKYWEEVWIELNSAFLSIYEIAPQKNIPIIHFSTGQIVIHKNDDVSFEISDLSNSHCFKMANSTLSKQWIMEIKHAKLAYWQVIRKDILTKPVTSSDDPILPDNFPLLRRTQAPVTQNGYLLKYEKDKKTYQRLWSVLQEQTLFFYQQRSVRLFFPRFFPLFLSMLTNDRLREQEKKLVGGMKIGNAMLRLNEVENDNFQFELVGTDETLLLEASDMIDLHSWQRALHSARADKKTTSAFLENVQKTGKLICFGRYNSTYWFFPLFLISLPLSFYSSFPSPSPPSSFLPHSSSLLSSSLFLFLSPFPSSKNLCLCALSRHFEYFAPSLPLLPPSLCPSLSLDDHSKIYLYHAFLCFMCWEKK